MSLLNIQINTVPSIANTTERKPTLYAQIIQASEECLPLGAMGQNKQRVSRKHRTSMI